MRKQGKKTEQFGKKLIKKFNSQFPIYFDHGDRSAISNVVACKAFYGKPEEAVHNVNRLSDVDILITDNSNNALIIIEIEERPVSPKKIIGDIFSLAMSNRIAIRKESQKYFSLGSNTKLFVVGILPEKGSRLKKVDEIIQKRILSFQRNQNEFCLSNIHLIFRGSIKIALDEAFKKINKTLTTASTGR